MRFLLILLLIVLALPASSSSMSYGPPVEAEVVSARLENKKTGEWAVEVRLLKTATIPNSKRWNPKDYLKGKVLTAKAEGATRSFAPGDRIKVRYMHYSAMGPNGPVSGLSWEIAP